MRTFSGVVDIQASPERVWAVMRDVTRWHEWTPLSLHFAGVLGPAFGWLTRGINTRYLGLEAAGLKTRCEAAS